MGVALPSWLLSDPLPCWLPVSALSSTQRSALVAGESWSHCTWVLRSRLKL